MRDKPTGNPSGVCSCGCGTKTKIATKTRTCDNVLKGQPLWWIKGHVSRTRERTYYVEDPITGCWEWQGYRTPEGYGRIHVRSPSVRSVLAHRWMYEKEHGQIPPGLCLDHLCRNRACVNPEHLEPVTWRENIMRGNGAAARTARGGATVEEAA